MSEQDCYDSGGTIYDAENEACLIEPDSQENEYPCPDPNAPFCGFSCEEIDNCNDYEPSEDSVVVVVDSSPPPPMAELPHTGGVEILGAIGLTMVAVGRVLVRKFG